MTSKGYFEGILSVWFLSVLGLMLPTTAKAHNGPPFPIIENRRVGPCVISLWTHPDVGTGAFFVFVDPGPGGAIPVWVDTVSGWLGHLGISRESVTDPALGGSNRAVLQAHIAIAEETARLRRGTSSCCRTSIRRKPFACG